VLIRHRHKRLGCLQANGLPPDYVTSTAAAPTATVVSPNAKAPAPASVLPTPPALPVPPGPSPSPPASTGAGSLDSGGGAKAPNQGSEPFSARDSPNAITPENNAEAITELPDNEKKSGGGGVPVGAIVGGVVSAAVLMAALVVFLDYMRRRNHPKNILEASSAATHTVRYCSTRSFPLYTFKDKKRHQMLGSSTVLVLRCLAQTLQQPMRYSA
jgi:hypothetical protein